MPAYLHDGYTARAYIAEAPRLHEAVTFQYRPALIEETSDLYDGADKIRAREFDRRAAGFIAKHLIEWNVRDPQNPQQTIQINPENLLRLNRSLFQRLLAIVTGSQAGDEADAFDLGTETKN